MAIYTAFPTEEQEKSRLAFLEENKIDFVNNDEKLPVHVLEGIARGQADIKTGRFITFEEFKKQLISKLYNDRLIIESALDY